MPLTLGKSNPTSSTISSSEEKVKMPINEGSILADKISLRNFRAKKGQIHGQKTRDF
jgi:hypothetical protein